MKHGLRTQAMDGLPISAAEKPLEVKVRPVSLWPDRAENVSGCHFFSNLPGVNMGQTFRAVPAFLACAVLSLCSGCSSLGSFQQRPDGSGGSVLYLSDHGRPRAVARLDSDGVVHRDSQLSNLERGGGGLAMDGVEDAAKGHGGHGHREAWEWLLCFTIIYLIIILIEMAIEAAEE
ncbi:hypothetical protein EDM80_13445, partial [bacterium]